MDQIDPEAVHDAQRRRLGQEPASPAPVGLEQAEQARALRQPGEQPFVIALQPAIEGPVADALRRVEQAQRDNLARPKARLGMLALVPHVVRYPATKLSDKVNRGHVG
jgi:hypothetical protein